MPPPRVVEKAIGEKRVVAHAPVGISVCPELDVEAVLAGIGEPECVCVCVCVCCCLRYGVWCRPVG